MAKRNPGNDGNLLAHQYDRLRDALEGFYSGKESQILNVVTTLRVLVHHKPPSSRSLLSRVYPDYWNLKIYDNPPEIEPGKVFGFHTPMQFTSDGILRMLRPAFDPPYKQVSIERWWNDNYQPVGVARLSKKTIVLNVANKDGGAHVDDEVPDTHAALTSPAFILAAGSEGRSFSISPNLAYALTAQTGSEMQECLERNFNCGK